LQPVTYTLFYPPKRSEGEQLATCTLYLAPCTPILFTFAPVNIPDELHCLSIQVQGTRRKMNMVLPISSSICFSKEQKEEKLIISSAALKMSVEN